MSKSIETMKPFQLKIACKKAGIAVAGKDADEMRAALSEAEGGKPAKSGKGGKPAKAGKGGKPAKSGKSGKPSKAKEEAADEETTLLEELVSDLSASMGERVQAIEDRLDALEEGGDDDDSDDDDDGDDDELGAAKETLSEYDDGEGGLDITPDHVKKFKKPQLEALATYIGIDYPDGRLPKTKRILAAAVKEALDEGGDDEGVPGFEGPDGEKIVAVDESIFDPKSWKKKGEFHGQSLYIVDNGTVLTVEVSAAKKDSDGDKYLAAVNDDGEKYTLFELGMEPDSGVGILGFAAE